MKLNAILFYVFWIVLSVVVLPFSLVYRIVHRLTGYTFKGVLVDYTKPFGKKAVDWFCRTFGTPVETLPTPSLLILKWYWKMPLGIRSTWLNSWV